MSSLYPGGGALAARSARLAAMQARTASEPNFSRRDLEGALEASGVGIWAWDIASGRVFWTPQLERMFGFAVGGYDGTFEAYEGCIAPEDRARVVGIIEGAMVTRSGYFISHRILRRDTGQLRYVECRGGVEVGDDGQPVRMTGTVLDVTTRREAEERLRHTDEVTRLLNDLASDYVYSVDLTAPRPVPDVVAGSFQRVTGYGPAEVEARGGWMQVVHPEDRVQLEGMLADGLSSQPIILEYRIVTPSGDVRWLRDHMRPQSDATGAVIRLVGGVKDITEQRRLEEQVRQGQKMEALARLAGGVAHDFNNLLTVIYGSVGILQATPRPDRDAAAIEAIATSAERAAELTQGLLALGRRQVGSPRAVSLGDALIRSRTLLERSLATGSRLELGEVPRDCTVRVDPGQLQLVLLNLVVNAGHAVGAGGVVRVEGRQVDFGVEGAGRPPELTPGRYGAIVVHDDGEGIPPEVLPRIFEPFFTTNRQGTGLGLAISHGIVSQHHGAMTVRSQPGKGTTFTVYLPVTNDLPSGETAPAPLRLSGGGDEGVLVVEDEPHLRALVVRVLRDLGYAVVEAGSGPEALAIPAAVRASVSLLLSDVQMPGMDGVSLARALREERPELAVLLMSGYAADHGAMREIASGAFPFLAKPFTPTGLANKVREVLDAASLTRV